MKIILLVLLGITFAHTAFAITTPLTPSWGSAANPIYIKEVPDYREKEQDLISRYGMSDYLSCRSKVCVSSGGNPNIEMQCLNQIETRMSFDNCGILKPITSCNDGFDLINGQCVRKPFDIRDAVMEPCPVGTYVGAGKCEPITCPEGHYLDGYSCIKIRTIEDIASENNSLCKGDFGQFSEWDGKTFADGTVGCGCVTGYVFNTLGTLCVSVNNEVIQSDTNAPKPAQTVSIPVAKVKEQFPEATDFTPVIPIQATVLHPASFRACPSTSCEVIRYYAETSVVNIDGISSDNNWFRVRGTSDAGGTGYPVTGWISKSVMSPNAKIEKVAVEKHDEATTTHSESAKTEPIIESNKNETGLFSRMINFFFGLFR